MAEEGKLSLEIVAPEKMVMTKKVDMVTISGAEGDFGVLPGHAALVSSIRPVSYTHLTLPTKRIV